MRCARVALALVAALGGVPRLASGQTVVTLAEVLTRVRAQAPDVVSARLAIEEARGRLAGASLRLTANPELDVDVGTRAAPGGRLTDFEVGLTQSLEPASRRDARVSGVNASIERHSAALNEATRLVLRSAAAAFYRAVHATERIRLLGAAEQLAAGIHQTASRRHQAGDIAVLDVNIARASLGRVRAEREAANALLVSALGDLKVLLKTDGDLRVQGPLDQAVPGATALAEAALDRPELKALEAAVREAEADVQLGRSFQKPDFGFGGRYARDSGDQVISGGLTISLPVFAKGQELLATGAARASRLRAELEAARARIRTELATAEQLHARRREAVRLLEDEALPGVDETDVLATRSFETGQIALTDLLLIRREILETRFQYLDAQLEAVLARIDVLTSAGVLR